MHPFDQTLALETLESGRLRGAAPKAYWNVVGPYGGISAALALRGVLLQANLLGEPLALTVNFVAPVRDSSFELEVVCQRSNRTTQHWHVRMLQQGADGSEDVVLQAMVVTGLRRPLWSATDAQAPNAPAPESLQRRKGRDQIAWFARYDLRFREHPFKMQNPADATVHWVRDDPPRRLDFTALTSMADTFFPSIFAHRKQAIAVATVSMNVYFHADASVLSEFGDGWLLGTGKSNVYSEGFFDAEAQLWAGQRLIATTQQVMWYGD